MVIRDLFVKINDGDQLNDGYFNGIPTIITNGDATDDADVGVSTSFTTAKTFSVAANAITDFVLIKFNMVASARAVTSGGDCTLDAKITIDSVQKFLRSVTAQGSGVGPSANGEETDNGRFVSFKYVPTSLEKSTGFVIDVDAQRSANSGNSGVISGFEIWGA